MVFSDWKISSFNGALIASYFVPSWGIPALKIIASPVQGLFYERANMAAGIFVSDQLQLAATNIVRFAWLLALAKLTVVAFFIVFVVLVLRPASRNRGGADEALAIALGLGGVVSFALMLVASRIGDPGILRMHATELLLLISIGIVALVEAPAAPVAAPAAPQAAEGAAMAPSASPSA